MASATLQVYRGEAFRVRLTLKNSVTGLPMNLTGYGYKMQFRIDENQDLLVEVSDTNGRAVLGGIAGTIDLTINGVDTKLFNEGVYTFDAFLRDPGSEYIFLFDGSLIVQETRTNL